MCAYDVCMLPVVVLLDLFVSRHLFAAISFFHFVFLTILHRAYALKGVEMERRKSADLKRQSILMTSGRAYTISGILSHQVLLSGVIVLAR